MTEPGGVIGSVVLMGLDDEVTYNWFHHGRGTESTTDANAERWRQVRDAYDEVLFLVRRGLAESKASWTGMAADGAHGAMSPVQAWVEETLDAAARASATVEGQSHVFSDTKARLSPPVPVPDKPWWNDFWPGETNHDKALEAKQANSIHNMELVRSYGDSTQANTAGYPAFGEPVVLATNVAPRPAEPGRPPNPGIAEWPAPPWRPATGGDSPPPASPGPEPPTTSSPPPVEAGPPTRSDSTVSSGHTQTPVTDFPPPRQDVPAGRVPVGGGPVVGLVGGPGTGAPGESGSGGRMPGGRHGEPGPGGRPGGGGADGRPGAGGRVSGGPGGVPAAEAVTGRGAAAGTRAGAGSPGGMVPAGGRPAGAEDEEHRNKFGPVGSHDCFWDDTPPVAPPVIGVDDEEP